LRCDGRVASSRWWRPLGTPCEENTLVPEPAASLLTAVVGIADGGAYISGVADRLDPARAYRILGLPPGAGANEVKAAYRDLVQVWHPDRFPADSRLRAKAERNLQRINAAYAVLKDVPPGAPLGPPPSRMRESFAVLLGLGDVRDSTMLEAPARAWRRSLQILGLDPAPERRNRLVAWLVAAVLLVVVVVVVGLLVR